MREDATKQASVANWTTGDRLSITQKEDILMGLALRKQGTSVGQDLYDI